MGHGNSKNGSSPNYMGGDGTFGPGPSTPQVDQAKAAKRAWFDSPTDLTDEELIAKGITGDAKNLQKFRTDRQIYRANKLVNDEAAAQQQKIADETRKVMLGSEVANQRKKELQFGRKQTLLSPGSTSQIPTVPKSTLLGQ